MSFPVGRHILGYEVQKVQAAIDWYKRRSQDAPVGVWGYGEGGEVALLSAALDDRSSAAVVSGWHGLDRRPQFLFAQEEVDRKDGTYTNFHFYQNIGSRLADLGFVVYMPQNPYIGDFRHISRLANPTGAVAVLVHHRAKHRLLDCLVTLPFVDPSRIGLYGPSYGGKRASACPHSSIAMRFRSVPETSTNGLPNSLRWTRPSATCSREYEILDRVPSTLTVPTRSTVSER